MEADLEFFKKQREDMYQTRQRRYQLELTKITTVGTLMGVGALFEEKIKTRAFFYFVPFIAIAFDLFILSQSYHLKRLGHFVSIFKERAIDAEHVWEQFIKLNPDKYGKYAGSVMTLSVFIASSVVLYLGQVSWLDNYWNRSWIVVTAMFIIIIKHREQNLHKTVFVSPERQSLIVRDIK